MFVLQYRKTIPDFVLQPSGKITLIHVKSFDAFVECLTSVFCGMFDIGLFLLIFNVYVIFH